MFSALTHIPASVCGDVVTAIGRQWRTTEKRLRAKPCTKVFNVAIGPVKLSIERSNHSGGRLALPWGSETVDTSDKTMMIARKIGPLKSGNLTNPQSSRTRSGVGRGGTVSFDICMRADGQQGRCNHPRRSCARRNSGDGGRASRLRRKLSGRQNRVALERQNSRRTVSNRLIICRRLDEFGLKGISIRRGPERTILHIAPRRPRQFCATSRAFRRRTRTVIRWSAEENDMGRVFMFRPMPICIGFATRIFDLRRPHYIAKPGHFVYEGSRPRRTTRAPPRWRRRKFGPNRIDDWRQRNATTLSGGGRTGGQFLEARH